MTDPTRRPPSWLFALLVVPILAGFVLLDAGVGMMIGVATAAALVVIAARAKVEGPIEVAEPAAGTPGGVMVVALAAIEDPRTAGVVAAIADPSRPESGPEGVLVLAPALSSRLDRWTSDLDPSRFESQRVLTVSIATLAAAGVRAEGRVGDGDPLQAIEDALRSYAATEVVVVAPEGAAEETIAALEDRLSLPLRRVAPG